MRVDEMWNLFHFLFSMSDNYPKLNTECKCPLSTVYLDETANRVWPLSWKRTLRKCSGTLNLTRWMCMGCASGVRLTNSQTSVAPRNGVSVTGSVQVRLESRDPVGKSFASAFSIMLIVRHSAPLRVTSGSAARSTSGMRATDEPRAPSACSTTHKLHW